MQLIGGMIDDVSSYANGIAIGKRAFGRLPIGKGIAQVIFVATFDIYFFTSRHSNLIPRNVYITFLLRPRHR